MVTPRDNGVNDRTLVVVVTGMFQSRRSWKPILEQLEALGHGPDWLVISFGLRFWSMKRLGSLAESLTQRLEAMTLDSRNSGNRPFTSIVLAGHSVGGLIARQAYLLGLADCAGFSSRRSLEWVNLVERIVLIGSPERGFEVRNRRLPFRVLVWLVRAIPFVRFTFEDLESGSPFVADLRIRWIRALYELPDERVPHVVQVLGTKDRLVKREESVDLAQFREAWHIGVPDATHGNVYKYRRKDRDLRLRRIEAAFFETFPEARACQSNATAPEPAPTVENIVFIFHGIRAGKYGWVIRLADCLRARPLEEAGWRVFAPSYGRVSALEFALPFTRAGSRNLKFFLNAYADHLADNPGATFHFVGHSNGTYLFGRAIKLVPALSFKNVVLAGSVLPQDFEWNEISRATVNNFRNDRVRNDSIVVLLCSAMRGLGMRDVGAAGVLGFDRVIRQQDDETLVCTGGHSGAFKTDAQRLDVVHYITDGQSGTQNSARGTECDGEGAESSPPSRASLAATPHGPLRFLSALLRYVTVFAVAAIFWGIYLVMPGDDTARLLWTGGVFSLLVLLLRTV